MRTNPHILEINTRSWLSRLQDQHGCALTLDQIPQEEWQKIRQMGFDAIWLMGVWRQSPKAQEIARNHPDILAELQKVVPQAGPQDIASSPYAVYSYEVDDSLGGTAALQNLRAQLKEMGISLILDFVGNHTAIDNPVVREHPEFFINTGTSEPAIHKDWFFKNEDGVHIAHGRDPYFAPWTDTAQLNYFNPATREYMLQNLQKVASLCDGVRCDMAMLSLNKVHRDTWWEFIGGQLPAEEFWPQALNAVQDYHPEFIFIAEVYWGLEWEIQQLGFDYTYDKILYDRLRFANPEGIKAHLGAEHLFQMRSLRFTANHDEEESIKAFGREKSLAASTIIATLPGARMFHLFQLQGRPARTPIQYIHDTFQVDPEVCAYYAKMLSLASAPAFHGGQWSLKEVPAADEAHTCKNVLAWQWRQMNTGKLVVINYSQEAARCRLPLKAGDVTGDSLREEMSGQDIAFTAQERAKGIELDLQPFESRIYTFSV